MLIVIIALVSHAYGTLIASSSVQRCIRDGSVEPAAMNVTCSKKLVVTLAVQGGQDGNEQLQTVVNSVMDVDGQTKMLESPYFIVLNKAPPVAISPLRYVQAVNNKPFEIEFIVSSYFFGIFGSNSHCRDGLDNNPSCGVALDAFGLPVINSQGFCCSCDLSAQLGISTNSQWRNPALNCELFGQGQASAQCLRLDDLFYNVFEVQPAYFYTAITAVLFKQSNGADTPSSNPFCAKYSTYLDSNWTCVDVLDVGTQRRDAVSQDKQVLINYIGDLASSQTLPDLTSRYLLVPEPRTLPSAQRATHPQIINGQKDWMLVDKTMVDLSGTVCNKVGVSYTAFNTQANACFQPFQSCLANQPKDLWQSDTKARAAGKPGKYFLGNFGTYSVLTSSTNASEVYLAYAVPDVQNSIVTLTLDADSIEFIINVSPGQINLAYIDDFVAFSGTGVLYVLVTNTGYLTAEYSVAINCTRYILPIPSQHQIIGAQQSWMAKFSVNTDVLNGEAHMCHVVLNNAIGELLDSVTLSFRTNSTCVCLGNCGCTCDSSPIQNCLSVSNPKISPGGSSGGGINVDKLFSWLNLSFTQALVVIIVIIVVIVLYCCCCARQNGGCLNCCGMLCCCSGKGGNRGNGDAKPPFNFKVYIQTVIMMLLLPLATAAWVMLEVIRAIAKRRKNRNKDDDISIPDESQLKSSWPQLVRDRIALRKQFQAQKKETSEQVSQLQRDLDELRRMQAVLRQEVNERENVLVERVVGTVHTALGQDAARADEKVQEIAAQQQALEHELLRHRFEAQARMHDIAQQLHDVCTSPEPHQIYLQEPKETWESSIVDSSPQSEHFLSSQNAVNPFMQELLGCKTVYFNMQGAKAARAASVFYRVGTEFSLIGTLKQVSLDQFLFSLHPWTSQTVALNEDGEYSWLQEAIVLSDDILQQMLTSALASKYLSTYPQYQCINIVA